jgi:hypothetical protein
MAMITSDPMTTAEAAARGQCRRVLRRLAMDLT